MSIAFIAFGFIFGAGAAVATLLAGGSILLAVAVYSGIGILGVLLGIAAYLLFSGNRGIAQDDAETTAAQPVSA